MGYKEKYQMRIDELNTISRDVFEELDKAKAKDEIIDIVVLAYLDGVDACNEMLETKLKPNTNKMYQSIYKSIANETINDRVNKLADNGTFPQYERLIESEFHRVYNEAIYDTAKDSGLKVKKTWKTMLDDKVRETHDYLEGQKIDLDKYFYTFDNDYALAPGGFVLAENNARCRCVLELSKE